MRIWLIGLGMVGTEFSMARKLMMKNLKGNSGWRYGKPENIICRWDCGSGFNLIAGSDEFKIVSE